jgi:N-acetylneuraminate lyase
MKTTVDSNSCSEIHAMRGPIAAVHTPFDASGRIDPGVVPAYAEHLRSAGIAAVYVCGSTGESLALTTAERRSILEAWTETAAGSIRIIAHVGSNALPEAEELARHAHEVGVDAISAMNPTFGRARNVDDLVRHHARIAAAGEDRPYLVYEISAFGGVSFPAAEVIERAVSMIPGFAGLKFTSSDPLQLQLAVALAETHGLRIFFGADENLLSGLAAGCVSAIGSTYGYAAEPAHAVFRAFAEGDMVAARAAQRRIARLVAPLLRHGVLRTGRALLETVGVPIGPPRSPETALEPEALATVLEEISPLGIPGLTAESDAREREP